MTFHQDIGFQPAPPSGFAAMTPGQTVDMAQKMRDIQGQNALGAAYAQAVDPTTGQIDPNKLQANLAGSGAPWMTGVGGIQAGQAMQNTNAGQQAQMETARQQMVALNGFLTPLLMKKNPDGTPAPIYADDIRSAYNEAQALGRATPTYGQQINTVLAHTHPGENLRDLVQSTQYQTLTAQQALEARLPAYQGVNLGNVYTQVQSNPNLPGYGQPVAAMPLGMSPEQAASVVDIKMSDGTTRQVQLGNVGAFLAQNPGSQTVGSPYSPGGGAARGPVTNQQFGGPNAGRYNVGQGNGGGAQIGTGPAGQPITATPSAGIQQQGQVTSQNLPPPPGTPGGQGGPTAALPTNIAAPTTIGGRQVATNAGPGAAPLYAQPPARGPAPVAGVSPSAGEVSSIGTVTGGATQAYNDLQNRVSGTKDQVPLIDNMISNLSVKGWAPGFGATVLGTVRQLMQRAGISPTEPGAGFNVSNAQAAQEEFAKNAGQLAAQQLKQSGNATDARQELAESTNPGMLLSRYGNMGILYMLKGTQLATQAEGLAWQKAQDSGWLPGANVQNNFNTWRTERFLATDPQTGGRFDPRVFWVGSMPKFTEQQGYLQTMNPDEQLQFRRNMQYAVDQGWLSIRRDGSVAATVGQ